MTTDRILRNFWTHDKDDVFEHWITGSLDTIEGWAETVRVTWKAESEFAKHEGEKGFKNFQDAFDRAPLTDVSDQYYLTDDGVIEPLEDEDNNDDEEE